jgi:hypothetical protein
MKNINKIFKKRFDKYKNIKYYRYDNIRTSFTFAKYKLDKISFIKIYKGNFINPNRIVIKQLYYDTYGYYIEIIYNNIIYY